MSVHVGVLCLSPHVPHVSKLVDRCRIDDSILGLIDSRWVPSCIFGIYMFLAYYQTIAEYFVHFLWAGENDESVAACLVFCPSVSWFEPSHLVNCAMSRLFVVLICLISSSLSGSNVMG